MSLLIRAFDAVAALALSFMLVIVSGQVITRAVYGFTNGAVDLLFRGSIELASYALLVVVFASFPRATASGLINVDLFTVRFPGWVNSTLDRFWALITALIAFGISWQAVSQTQSSFRRNFTTQDLDIPLYFFYGYIVISAAVFGLVALSLIFRHSGQPDHSRPEDT